MTQETDKNQAPEKSSGAGTITRAAAGGVLGAAAGYISSDKNRKKLKDSISKEKLKDTGTKISDTSKRQLKQLKDAGKEKSNQAINRLKSSSSPQTAENLTNDDDENEGYTTLENGTDNESDSDYDNLKLENEELQNRLNGLEEKMDKLIELQSKSADAEKTQETSNGQAQDESSGSQPEKSAGKSTKEKSTSNKNGNSQKPSKKKKTSETQNSKTKTESENAEAEEETGLDSDDDTSA
ncbi:hypothetical protein SAMN05216238_101182 [Lentibacillus persicus]|uniref:Gas vesicle protein n=1 Tax=Lentibacillus persicus TaxID=640948 RepID=A0A1I1SBJ6_9BACI|nr:GvpT/GvpP family gas vesicle accessory protein [Lentibacillus persicus]SFD40370.1 hypothetical protein SAMN05216238_101182 [Lentibacillus persicus]